MLEKIKFIHCADLHLDSPFRGLQGIPERMFREIKESTFHALENLTEQAIKLQVDFVLMVGDLFDQEEQSLKAHMALKKSFEKLQEHDIQVYVSFGNHDYLNGQTFSPDYPDNVHVFQSETVEAIDYWKKNTLLAKIYGFSYENREVLTSKTAAYKKTADPVYHIATLHGAYGREEETGHKNYAPFQLSELKNAGFDYWALGHIHKRDILSENPPIVYPGNTQGRSAKETGEKGCYLVTLENNEAAFTFLPLQHIRFEKLSIDAGGWTSITEAAEQLETLITSQDEEQLFLQLWIENLPKAKVDWILDGDVDEVIDYVNQQAKHSYIIQYKWETETERMEWQQGGKFVTELKEMLKETQPTDIVKPLWKHKEGRKWLSPLEDTEKQELMEHAELLIDQLLHEKEV